MTNSDEPPASIPQAQQLRKAREAAALRENLRRRKQQGRARSLAAPEVGRVGSTKPESSPDE